MKKWLVIIGGLAAVLVLAACQPEVVEKVVEVTKLVETEKEIVVTQIVEIAGEEKVVEVTKIVTEQVVVEVTPEPEAVATEPQRGGTLYMSLGPDFTNFDPFFDVDNKRFKPVIFEAPLRIGDDGQLEPWLAESWEISDDRLTITLHMRHGIKFHNGRELTAEDVVWSVDRARDQEIGHHLGDFFTTCTGASAVDDYTVDITFSEVSYHALDGLGNMYMYPKEAADEIMTVPVGTGPFMFEEWVPGDHLTLTAFQDYWQEGLPYLDGIVVKPIPDVQARMVNLLAGSIDLLHDVPWADISLLEQAGMNIAREVPGFRFDSFMFNVTRPPFDNTLVRQAMNYAVDREKMRELVYANQGIMTTLPMSELNWAYPKDLADYYTFDLDKAKELLVEAGYPDGFETEITIRGTGGAALDLAQVYQQDLAKIGVELTILPTELPQYWPLLFASDFAIVSHATGAAATDPAGFFRGAACCRPFRNFFMITENDTWFPEYEAAIQQASSERDQEVRKQLYHDAMAIFVEQGWTIPLGWGQAINAYPDKLHGFRTDMAGYIWLNNAWLAP